MKRTVLEQKKNERIKIWKAEYLGLNISYVLAQSSAIFALVFRSFPKPLFCRILIPVA
jgi:hypothetical protein